MRRAKIRPSINLSASRRSVATPAAKDKDSATSKSEAAGSKTGLRSASKPSTPQPAQTQTVVDLEATHGTNQQQSTGQEKQQQQQQQQQQQHPQDKEKQSKSDEADGGQTTAQQRPKPVPPAQDAPRLLPKPAPVSPIKLPSTCSTPSKSIPESPTKSGTVRRKRITAVPNLGQPRLRSTPSQAGKTSARPQIASEKENEAGKVVGGDRQESTDGEMGPPPQPPPVQRIIAASSPSTPAVKEPARVVPTAQDTPSQPEAMATPQMNHTPSAMTTPLRANLSRSESTAEKRPPGSENIYEKKLRELKDRIDSETPSRRRRHYVKQKIQPPERSKMTMSDLIYFNPKTSPMKNTSASKEKKFPRTIMTEHVVSANNSVNNSAHNSENEDEEEKEEDVDPFAPQVKIGPDGNIILDSSSLVKDASPAKTLHLSDSDIIQEETSHTTYASFRKRTHTTAWSEKDTAKFYKALSAVGTDFTMINAMFPKRTRQQIKNKFKREERLNRQRLDKAIRERQHFDISLFDKDTSSDSETENHVDEKTKARGNCKGGVRGKGKGRGKGKTKQRRVDKDDDVDKDSDVESVGEVNSKGDAEEGSQDAAVEGENQDTAARQSDGSDEEISMETILSQPTRSGRQPKFKTSFTVEDAPKRTRGPYRKTQKTIVTTDYALNRMERLSKERAEALAKKTAAKVNFPPYTPGGLSQLPSLHPPVQQTVLAGVNQGTGIPLTQGDAGSTRDSRSPGSRGISTITTPMGRFIVSVPHQSPNRQGGTSPNPVGPASVQTAALSAGTTRPVRTHIFVISSPDGTQNIIQVPVQPETSSSDILQSQGPAPPPGSLASGLRVHNPMTTPRLIVRTLTEGSQQNPTVLVPPMTTPSVQQSVTSPPSTACDPRVVMSLQGQRAKVTQSAGQNQGIKRKHLEPVTLPPSGESNKVIVMSPHAHAQNISNNSQDTALSEPSIVRPVMDMTTTNPLVTAQPYTSQTSNHQDDGGHVAPLPAQQHETLVTELTEPTYNDTRTNNLTPDPAQKVSHMTSDTDTDWLLRDATVGHEVDIPTTDFVEEETETEEAFIPPASNVNPHRQPPLRENETDQIIMSHVTEEHLSAQDILEQMTYEEGFGGDVGANMEVAINEEIITQIATELTVE